MYDRDGLYVSLQVRSLGCHPSAARSWAAPGRGCVSTQNFSMSTALVCKGVRYAGSQQGMAKPVWGEPQPRLAAQGRPPATRPAQPQTAHGTWALPRAQMPSTGHRWARRLRPWPAPGPAAACSLWPCSLTFRGAQCCLPTQGCSSAMLQEREQAAGLAAPSSAVQGPATEFQLAP